MNMMNTLEMTSGAGPRGKPAVLAPRPRGCVAALAFTAACAIGTIFAAPAFAHGGEDHGEEDHGAPPAAAAQAVAPRAASTSDDFELVAILDDRRLVVYLDESATNAPIDGAAVEVEGSGIKAEARPLGGGVYEIAGAGFAPGTHPLVFTVQAGDSADLLEAQLDVPQPSEEGAGTGGGRKNIVWGTGFLGSLLGVAALMRLRRRGARAESRHA